MTSELSSLSHIMLNILKAGQLFLLLLPHVTLQVIQASDQFKD